MTTGPSGRGSDPRRRAAGPRARGAARRPVGSSSPGARGGARPAAGPRRGSARSRAAAATDLAPRPRFTGRAAILVLVVALLMVSYASSMRAWLDQRRHLASLSASIDRSQAQVDQLTREKKRWQDPAYVRKVAHQRFGWVLPGEIGFQVLDEDGKPMGHTETLSPRDAVTQASRPLWWQSAWGSVVTAGKPEVDPADVPPPVTRIRAPRLPAQQSDGEQR
jgi:cell division protein FtsB